MTALAQELGLTVARVSQLVAKAGGRWLPLLLLQMLRPERRAAG